MARTPMSHQERYIGDKAVGCFYSCKRMISGDYEGFKSRGVEFVREPKVAGYGTVTVFRDLYGTLWDLVEFGGGKA